MPGYKLETFVEGWLGCPSGQVPKVSTRLSLGDRLRSMLVRSGFGRDGYRIAPGLYAVGDPGADSPVLVTANYKLTFDCLRRELAGRSFWIMVLETYGINVWCAAGKKTFSTEEVANRVRAVGLEKVVSHRTLILPQLAAPGVAAWKVKKLCGFSVVYSPIKAGHLVEFIENGMKAEEHMREVTFSLAERMAVAPVEIYNYRRHALYAAVVAFLLAGIGPDIFSFSRAWALGLALYGVLLAAFASGAFLVPLLLPWLPGRAFWLKGAAVGAVVALGITAGVGWGAGESLAVFLGVVSLSSYFAMNYTGSTPFTSPSGVEKEMRWAIPLQLAGAASALLIWIGARFWGGLA